jgi:F0F1-type ATP synthase epsilon subunit
MIVGGASEVAGRRDVTLTVKSEKREDKLPLERALRALEDVRKLLKKLSTTEADLRMELPFRIAPPLTETRAPAQRCRVTRCVHPGMERPD